MNDEDRLAYELAMVTLQDRREDCLRWLEDQKPVIIGQRSARWWRFLARAILPRSSAS